MVMIRTLLLFAIITALGSLPVKAQSEDGWFSGRLLLCCSGDEDTDCRAQVMYAHYFNFNNYVSSGFGTGLIMGSRCMVPITADVRLRPTGHRRVMPVIAVTGGYAVPLGDASGQTILTPRIGLDGGRLARMRVALDVGCQVLGGRCGWIVGAGFVF